MGEALGNQAILRITIYTEFNRMVFLAGRPWPTAVQKKH